MLDEGSPYYKNFYTSLQCLYWHGGIYGGGDLLNYDGKYRDENSGDDKNRS